MKTLLLLLFTPFFSLSQTIPSSLTLQSKGVKAIVKQAYKAMKRLDILIRTSSNKDGELLFFVSSDVKTGQAAFQYLKDDTAGIGANRVYKKPRVLISQMADSVLSNKGIFTHFQASKATCTICHEICHYLQVPIDGNSFIPPAIIYNYNEYVSTMRSVINQNNEFDAWTVGAYCYLEKENPIELMRIMGLNINLRKKCELLINAYRFMDNPDNPRVFDKE